METHLHTGASASIHINSRSSPVGGLPATRDGLIEEFGPVGAATGPVPASHGSRDDAHPRPAQSTIDLATSMRRPGTSRDGAIACLPLRGQPLDATAPAFAIAVRPA
ncbi:hypothetical protein [Burkholderia lata]|uniref:hypothetical protein n=1 Tax=Burkholderia lata (strain ATCC 17760 / DSM 23089 / LMG 22485 / NCIMB 9086 / R18194 / 383) TaxID=482957 RepID=UPI00399BF4C6